MEYVKEALENGAVKFTYTVTGETWDKAIDEAYFKNKRKFKINGFRPGEAPKNMVFKQYGKGSFYEEAIDALLDKAYQDLMAEKPLDKVYGRPQAGLDSVTDDKCVFTITLQGKPEVKLGAYKGLSVKKDVKEVTAAEIDARIKQDVDRATSLSDVERPVANGDIVNLDYSGAIDGVKFQGGTAEKQTLEIGSGTFIPGFEEGLIGTAIGETKDVTVKFPDDYGATELAGKEAVFTCKINAIQVKNVPELNDEFAEDVSEFSTFEEYRNDIEAKLKKDNEEKAEIEAENALVDLIADSTEVTIPESMIDDETENSIEEFAYRLQQQGLNLKDYFKYTGTTIEDMKKQYRERSLKNCKIKLIIEEIIKAENIDLTDEEMDAKLREAAARHKKPEEIDEFVKTASEEYKNYVKQSALSDKLMAFLKDNNTID